MPRSDGRPRAGTSWPTALGISELPLTRLSPDGPPWAGTEGEVRALPWMPLSKRLARWVNRDGKRTHERKYLRQVHPSAGQNGIEYSGLRRGPG